MSVSDEFDSLVGFDNTDLAWRELWSCPRLFKTGISELPLGELMHYRDGKLCNAPVYLRDGSAALDYLRQSDPSSGLFSHATVADIIRDACLRGWYASAKELSDPFDARNLPVGLLFDRLSPDSPPFEFRDDDVIAAAMLLILLELNEVPTCQAEIICRVWLLSGREEYYFLLPTYTQTV